MNATVYVLSIWRCCAFILEDNILHISESCSDALQQQVEGLDRDELCVSLLLQAIFSSCAQRETQVQLQIQKH